MRDGEVLTALRGSLTTTKEELADIWSTGEFDYIWIDSQHTPFSEEQLVAYCGRPKSWISTCNCASRTPGMPIWSGAISTWAPARS